jgi:hypothetical protein
MWFTIAQARQAVKPTGCCVGRAASVDLSRISSATGFKGLGTYLSNSLSYSKTVQCGFPERPFVNLTHRHSAANAPNDQPPD